MRYSILLSFIFMAALLPIENSFAYNSYTGYSGAPGRQACSVSCHHRHSYAPTITVTGFPETYVPGQQYTIAMAHVGQGSISQFNCSARVGTGSANAGVLTSGTGTATYNTSGETNGVHGSVSGLNSGTFLWTAPAAGTGTVRLYWAGLQGSFSNGADTQIVLVSTEAATGIEEDQQLPQNANLSQNYPNPFNGETVISFSLSQPGNAALEISNILGQRIYTWTGNIAQAGETSIHWDGKSQSGADVPSGIYFYHLSAPGTSLVRRMVLLR
jgi:hypothetical protein